MTNQETFQLEFNHAHQAFAVSTNEGLFWAVGGASLQTSAKERAEFKVVWNAEDGSCSLMVSGEDDKWICARKSGQMFCGCADQRVRFFLRLLNRNQLNLRASSASGFVGLKLPGNIVVTSSSLYLLSTLRER